MENETQVVKETTTEAVEAVTTETAVVETAAIDYTDFAIPEGAVVDDSLMTEFLSAAKESGLTQAQAQKLIDMGAQNAAKIQSANEANIEAKKTEWAEASKNDKEIGGEHFEANLAIAALAVEKLATPELKALLDSTGLGNHPDMIKAFYKAGKLLGEDTVVTGGNATSTQEQSIAQRMFPGMNP